MKSLPPFTRCLCLAACVSLAAVCAAESGAVGPSFSDWPQWQGPNRSGIVLHSPRLIDHVPPDGPRLVWKTEGLPYAPLCGIGSPILAGGKVYTYAHTVQGLPGVKPFAGLLTKYGYAADMPPTLIKKVEETQYGAKRTAAKTDMEIDAVTKELLDSLDPEQAKKYSEVIRLRMKLGSDGFEMGTLASFAAMRDKEIDSREDFLNWFVENMGHTFYHGRGAAQISPYANEVYKEQHAVDMMICLDQATGKELWRKSLPGARFSVGTEFGCSGTPIATRDRVYFRGSGGLHCLDAKQGELVWQAKGPPGNNSPLLVGNVVYCILDKLYAFDAATGKVLWSQPKVSSDVPTPVLWTHAGKNYLLSMMYGSGYYMPFFCLDAETGKDLWMVPSGTKNFGAMANASYSVSGDIVIVRGSEGCAALALSPEKYEILWLNKNFGDMGGAPIVYKDHVYLCGHAYGNVLMGVVELKTGKITMNEVQEQRRGECSSPLLADDKIFMTGIRDYRTCHLIVARATPDKYEELGCMSAVPMAACSSPAFADGIVFVRLPRGVACYDFVEHGVYFDGVTAKKDSLTFRFGQTGGGLVAKDAANGLADVVITDAAGAARPARATIAGDTLVVDIKDVPVPFGISCAANKSLVGKNSLPAPAFNWNEARALTYRNCFDNTIVLASALPLNETWNSAAIYTVAGAAVTAARIDPSGKSVTLTTDKTWKAGDAVTLNYSCFQVEQGEPRREKLTFTAPEIQRAAVKFVKTDETTAGTWKGIYGGEGAVLAGEPAAAIKLAVVTVKNNDNCTWAGSTADARAPQKTADAKDRIVACWYKDSSFDIDVELTDGREHQVALYGLDWDGSDSRAMTVEVQDGTTNAVLDKQTVKQYSKGSYVIWNVKGHVTLHCVSTGAINAVVSGLFIDPAHSDK